MTGRIGTLTTLRLLREIDLYESLCNRRHPLSVLRFSSPRNRNRYIFFFEPCEVPTVSPFFNFSCKGSFFFGQFSKCLSDDRLRCEHRRFYMIISVGLVSYILADLGPRGELLTKQTSVLVQPYGLLARTALKNLANLFSPATFSLASLHEMHVRARRHFKRYASESTQDKINRDKMADIIVDGVHDISNSWL